MHDPYVIYLYAEGGDRDGEAFACGPYEGGSPELDAAASRLKRHGSTMKLKLHPDGDALLRELA